MTAKLIVYWNSLPAAVKTAVVIFGGAATGVLKHALEQPNACMTAVCLKGYAVSAAHAGGLALFTFLLPSPLGKK